MEKMANKAQQVPKDLKENLVIPDQKVTKENLAFLEKPEQMVLLASLVKMAFLERMEKMVYLLNPSPLRKKIIILFVLCQMILLKLTRVKFQCQKAQSFIGI